MSNNSRSELIVCCQYTYKHYLYKNVIIYKILKKYIYKHHERSNSHLP